MAFSFEKKGAIGMLQCEGSLEADRAQTLRDALMVCIENSDHVVINCGKVKTIDSQCIQIFCTAHRMAVRADKKLIIIGIAPDINPSPQEISNLCLSRSAIGCNKSCIWMPTEGGMELPTAGDRGVN
ncbi:MAG: STAS domain-containing protein [Nitrospirae bacterium]|nr:STAS domain-containing protein [Nitrospirota bacterium]